MFILAMNSFFNQAVIFFPLLLNVLKQTFQLSKIEILKN